MRLPRINLKEIYQMVLLESVPADNVRSAIHNRNYVEVNYIDENSNAPGRRVVQPYVYGLTKAGNPAVLVFQVEGDSYRNRFWKLMLLDRIASWKPRRQTFNVPPEMQGYDNVPAYRRDGCKTMSVIFDMVQFDNIDFNDTLSMIRAQSNQIEKVPKIISKNRPGPIPYANQQKKKNVFTSQPNSKRYAEYAKNVQNAQKDNVDRFNDDVWAKAEAERQEQNFDGYKDTALQPTKLKNGPIDRDRIIGDEEEDEY